MQSLKAFLAAPAASRWSRSPAPRARRRARRAPACWCRATAIFGTIGGGQLEYMAIDKARQMLGAGRRRRSTRSATLDIPLGPEIGQCCGGRVEVLIRLVDAALARRTARGGRGRGRAACRMSISSAAAMSARRWRRRSRCCRCAPWSSRRAPKRWRACRTASRRG